MLMRLTRQIPAFLLRLSRYAGGKFMSKTFVITSTNQFTPASTEPTR